MLGLCVRSQKIISTINNKPFKFLFIFNIRKKIEHPIGTCMFTRQEVTSSNPRPQSVYIVFIIP